MSWRSLCLHITWQMIGGWWLILSSLSTSSKLLRMAKKLCQLLLHQLGCSKLQVMYHRTIEHQQCGVSIVLNKMTPHKELEQILKCSEKEESIADIKPILSSLPKKFTSFSSARIGMFSKVFKGVIAQLFEAQRTFHWP